MRRLTIDGNTKLGMQVGTFNVPPVKTCTPTGWCLTGWHGKPLCYALRNNCRFSNVVRSCRRRLKASKKADFVERVTKEIQARFDFFRIHALGDYYSVEYVQKWHEIVRECPKTRFMTTTRRRDLTKPLVELNTEPNIIVRESLDTDRSVPEMGLQFAAVDSIEIIVRGMDNDLIVCPGGCEECGYKCWKDHRSLIFPVH